MRITYQDFYLRVFFYTLFYMNVINVTKEVDAIIKCSKHLTADVYSCRGTKLILINISIRPGSDLRQKQFDCELGYG